MQKTVLNDVFELLQQIGAVSSESEFSRDWALTTVLKLLSARTRTEVSRAGERLP